jgi:hypothetical protein
LASDWIKIRITQFLIDNIYEDLTADNDWFRTFIYYTDIFTAKQKDFILEKTKITNWPYKFRSKELLRRNQDKFKKLIGRCS